MIKKSRLVVLIAFIAIVPIVFSACGSAKVKTFTNFGMTITATNKFKIRDVAHNTLWLETKTITISGRREMPTINFPITKTLAQYTEEVLWRNRDDFGEEPTPEVYSEGGTVFHYFFFDRDVGPFEKRTVYTYLAVTMKGTNAFYFFNFACEQKDFSKNQSQFWAWAILLEVV